MRINELLEDLIKEAPKAVFTKGEALVKTREIIAFVLDENEASEYETALLNDINLSIESFDDSSSRVDNLLDDVKFLGFEVLNNVIDSEICKLESTNKYDDLDQES